mmetsp:Transcript_13729/g.40739  ORF Transcript_13729/g.40739 Transcript_13729/m.40739 type:complete len:209 (-) Transcript_13729:61-687(-)
MAMATVPRATKAQGASYVMGLPTPDTLTSWTRTATTAVTCPRGPASSCAWCCSSYSPQPLAILPAAISRVRMLAVQWSDCLATCGPSGEKQGCGTRSRCWWASTSAWPQCRASTTCSHLRGSSTSPSGSTSSSCHQSLSASLWCPPPALATIAHASGLAQPGRWSPSLLAPRAWSAPRLRSVAAAGTIRMLQRASAQRSQPGSSRCCQ